MGAYLSSPALEKKSQDFEDIENYQCGVSGMQGWRISMEDAHNCIPNIGDGTSLFAVYDGHGGSEVAIYCALHFADVLKETDEYKSGHLEKALSNTFMEIDRKLKEPAAIRELKVLSQKEPGDPPPTEDDFRQMEKEDEEDEDETRLLYEEATMNINDLLARYGRVANRTKEMLENITSDQEEKQSSSTEKADVKETAPGASVDDSQGDQTTAKAEPDVSSDAVGTDGTASSETVVEKESAQGPALEEIVPRPLKKTLVKCKLAKPDGEDSSDDEDYDGFESDEAIGGSSSDEDEEDSEEESDEIDDAEEERDGREEGKCENTEGPKQEGMALSDLGALGSGTEVPGSDSGTTAVVALLRDFDLHVANAGDSRCVLCRKDGKAFDMSDDHKPEDEKELNRIQVAGGHVNVQGRVNGGLNLSRAIGDHCYKTNESLPLEEQMISAMPDVRSVKLEAGDEFMVLACDGIWNVMSSQEVVDFVRERLSPQSDATCAENGAGEKKPMKLTEICEELFDKCLAPDTMGDGTGCDNMTCLIVRFSARWLEGSRRDSQQPSQSNADSSSVSIDYSAAGDKALLKSDGTAAKLGETDNNVGEIVASKRPRTDDIETRVNGGDFEAKRIKVD